MNSFGNQFVFTSFGESHGRAIGGVLDGVPAGLHIDMAMIRRELDRRAGRPSQSPLKEDFAAGVSQRAKREDDDVEWLSGVMDGVTLGTPIAFIIRNKDARPEDYEWLKHNYRAGHADWTYQQKYGIRDWRGGGRASARETAGRVVAGCIAKQLLRQKGIRIEAELVQVGSETDPTRFGEVIHTVQVEGDSIGGIVRCTITGVPVGTGEPIFNKLQAELAFAMMSINACKGFDYGSGFEGVGLKGSEANRISGGMAGGITDGTPIVFRCVFKPTPSIAKWGVRGRHDACVAVRAVPVVEAMAAMAVIQFEL
ncbi:MAG: chorismate synthase [Paludibacteraceae bacterium]